MSGPTGGIDPVPRSAWPTFTPVTGPPPSMPSFWSATVLLQAFSPPQSTDPNPTTPFFQLCVGSFMYLSNTYFSAMILGCQTKDTWWYIVTPTGTQVSFNGGAFTTVNIGWSMPTNWFGGASDKAVCCGASPLNWMGAQTVDWWRVPVPGGLPFEPAATWMWFDSNTAAPVRMMFGQGPVAGPNMGDPTQLAILQMYSFSYFPVYSTDSTGQPMTVAQLIANGFTTPTFDGFEIGNPKGFQKFVWNGNFGMTVFMTPVNERFAPLPTRVLYVWKPDDEYKVYSDRSQDTLMDFTFNVGVTGQGLTGASAQEALLTGPGPSGIHPPNSDTSFLITYFSNGDVQCVGQSGPQGPTSGFDFPQEPPDWISMVGPTGSILQATITNNPVLGPSATVTVYSVLFPKSPPNYPESTYLWTWYTPLNASGTASRPITFMQSQSGVGVGTSLALADYFYYQIFSQPIDPANFAVPKQCPIPPPPGAHWRPHHRKDHPVITHTAPAGKSKPPG